MSGTYGKGGGSKTDPIEIRFWKRVLKGEGDACWEWQGLRSNRGYGRIVHKRKLWLAHRLALHLEGYDVSSDTAVCHACDNPPCVRPSHLWTGTQAQNLADMRAKGRQVDRGMQGEEANGVRLTNEDVLAIKIAISKGITHQMIADDYSVARTTIGRIARGETWTHIGGGE